MDIGKSIDTLVFKSISDWVLHVSYNSVQASTNLKLVNSIWDVTNGYVNNSIEEVHVYR